MNIIIPLMIIVALLVYLGFRWNNIRTKFAFIFILFGILVTFFFIFLISTGSSFDFSNIEKVTSSIRVYFLWFKGLISNVFEVTGKAIGIKGQYVEYIGNNATG